MNKKIPRPPVNQPYIDPLIVRGFGTRYLWPLPPVGESQRRDPHMPDPPPQAGRVPVDQADASPSVPAKQGFGAGGGVVFNGFPSALQYIKALGFVMQRTLAENYRMGITDGQWRLGGIALPFDRWGLGYGFGYTGDSASLVPDNPQVYMRNPGIRPLSNVPATFRYAPNLGTAQPLGPSIGDVGNIAVGPPNSATNNPRR
jgi:hypothetical protein